MTHDPIFIALQALSDKIDALREEMRRDASPLPESYELDKARELLGGISRSTVYREIHNGLLERVPNTRRVLITRESIEKRKAQR